MPFVTLQDIFIKYLIMIEWLNEDLCKVFSLLLFLVRENLRKAVTSIVNPDTEKLYYL